MFTDEEFIAVAERYKDTVYRIAYCWLRDPYDADDVTQEVLIKLYRTDKDFGSDSYIRNWLIRVTINQCKMIFRAPWNNHSDIEEYMGSLYFEDEDYRELFEAVMSLDKKYRVPLILFYYEGYSTAEISEIMQIPENTVSTRLRRARAKLRKYLEEDIS